MTRHQRYDASAKGRARHRRYNVSGRGRERYERYESTRLRLRMEGIYDESYRLPTPEAKAHLLGLLEERRAQQREEYRRWKEEEEPRLLEAFRARQREAAA